MSEEQVFEQASAVTGIPVDGLKRMARGVFASMLLHAMANPNRLTWTHCAIRDGKIELEVDSPPVRRTPIKIRPQETN